MGDVQEAPLRGMYRDRSRSYNKLAIPEQDNLFNFQRDAVNFLKNDDRFAVLLNLDPGMGKTVILREYIASLPRGMRVLYLTVSGLPKQTADCLKKGICSGARSLDLACVNSKADWNKYWRTFS